jgi:hypothetical protein
LNDHINCVIHGGRVLRKGYEFGFLIAISFSVIFTGLACVLAADEVYTYTSTLSGHIYNMDQNVKGNGFFNSYQTLNDTHLVWSNKAHGSGSYDYEAKIDSRVKAKLDSNDADYKATADQGMTYIESTDFSYAPAGMQMGKYSLPIAFQSKGAETTCIKNYVSNVSMDAMFNYADTLSKNLSSELYWNAGYNTSGDYDNVLGSDARTKLNFEAAFSGSGHVGALDMSRGADGPDILIDEDYKGTYYITKNMSHEVKYNLKQQIDEWLPCCYGGYLTLPLPSRGDLGLKGAKGVFDCSCFKAPSVAEFPRTYPTAV